jgi:hypothetical protein
VQLSASVASLNTGSSRSARSLFPTWKDVLDGEAWARAYDVARFGACARALIGDEGAEAFAKLSMREYISKEGYSETFVRDYLNVGTLFSSNIWCAGY